MTTTQTISTPAPQARTRVSATPLLALTLILAGVAALVLALALDGAALERTLRGQTDGALAWGPALFRALLVFHGLLLLAAGARRWRTRTDAGESSLPQPPTRDRTTATQWWLLLLLLVAATLLRLWRLDSGLWLDEILMLADFVRPPMGHIVTSFPSQNQHMFYSVLAHGLFDLFGESIRLYRLPAVAFGVGSILALFVLARRIAGTREALMASALMTLSYHHVWFSQNARGYSGLLLFATLATWLWIEALPRTQWRWWIAYAVCVALGMWLHLTMAFIPLVHGLAWLVLLARSFSSTRQSTSSTDMASRWQPIAALVLAGTLTLQLYALSLPEFLRVGLHEESKESSWTNPLWLITETFRGLQTGYAGVALIALTAGVIGAALGLRSIARRNWVAAVCMVLPGILLGAMIVALRHNLWPRFFFFCAGFAIVVAVRGTSEVAGLLSTAAKSLTGLRVASPRLAMAMWTIVVASSALTLPRCYGLPKQNFGGARDYVVAQTSTDDVVVAIGLAASAYQRYYAPHWPTPRTPDELRALRDGHRSTWLLYTMPIHLQAFEPPLWEIVSRDFEVMKSFPGTLGGGDVFVCRQRSPRTATAASGVATER